MNKSILTFLIAGLAGSLTAGIDLTLENPDTYRDFQMGGRKGEAVARLFESEFARTAESRFSSWIPEGHTLELVITDVDMAGDIQPWRNRDFADIRYVERLYPPMVAFRYSLKDAEGTEVLSGEERVRNLAFDFSVRRAGHQDTFHYEFAVIEDWLRQNIRPLTR